jgi:hypothetical protein
MVLTVSFVLSPVTGFLATVACADRSAKLDASIGAPGPYDFAVRNICRSSCDVVASTASRSTFRDDRDTPLLPERDGAK